MIFKTSLLSSLIFLCEASLLFATPKNQHHYPWLTSEEIKVAQEDHNMLAERISPPSGAQRVELPPHSFAQWLRWLPLKPKGAAVHLHTGQLKPNQNVHHAVVQIDVGTRDLQQCADAVIRLRAEYLYAKSPKTPILFHYTTGDKIPFQRWAKGARPKVKETRVNGKRRWSVHWKQTKNKGRGRKNFSAYLKNIFMYAGTASLSRHMKRRSPQDAQVGDVYIQGGFPGHAVIIVDLARHPQHGLLALLAQSYMPAQDLHILKNLEDPTLSPWFKVPTQASLQTPEWTFKATDLKRFN